MPEASTFLSGMIIPPRNEDQPMTLHLPRHAVRISIRRSLTQSSLSIRVLPSVFGFTRSRSRNSATPSSYERNSSA